MEGVTRMIWNKGHILNHLEVQGVADLQVLPFHGQCESGGCGRSCSVVTNLILHLHQPFLVEDLSCCLGK